MIERVVMLRLTDAQYHAMIDAYCYRDSEDEGLAPGQNDAHRRGLAKARENGFQKLIRAWQAQDD